MHQALYRKYRPQTFDDVCGQEHITSVLKYETARNKTSHAYLFCGSRGTGKTSCAKILAKAINCLDPQDGNPCCKCRSCLDIDAGAATDVLEMDAASNNGVDYIREIRDEVAFTPAMLKKRVYIIDEVHMLTTSAFNALLKTLEEPPEHVVFILATTELYKLPATIISRCQRFDFRRITVGVLADRIKYIAKNEDIVLEPDAAEMIAKQAQGGMRDAISIFELCSGGGSDVTYKRVSDILGLTGYDMMHDTVLSIAKGDMSALFSVVAETVSSSKDLTVFLGELMSFYRDMLVAKYSPDPSSYLDLTSPEKAMLQDAASKLSLQTIIYHCNVLDSAMQSLLRSPQTKRTTVEFALMRMCDPKLDTSTDALSARVEALEDKLALLNMAKLSPSDNVRPAPTNVASAEVRSVNENRSSTDVAADSDKASAEPVREADGNSDFTPLYDISDVTDRLARLNKGLCSFLSDSEILVSHDKRKLLIHAPGEFEHMMLSGDQAVKSIAEAFALSGVTDGAADIRIDIRKGKKSSGSPADELFKADN